VPIYEAANPALGGGMKALFVGWGDVAQRFYAPAIQRFRIDSSSITIAERPGLSREIPGLDVAEWGSADLKARLASGEFDRIILLSPPQEHTGQVLRLLELLEGVSHSCLIATEKPLGLDADATRRDVQALRERENASNHRVRCIDHYVEKWTTRVLSRLGYRGLSKLLGKLKHIQFVSMEEKQLWDSTAFEYGYFREHGVHAWAVLEAIGLAAPSSQLEAIAPARLWRHLGCPESCRGDTAALAQYAATLPGGESAKISLAIGKGVGKTRKALRVVGEKRALTASFDAEEFHSMTYAEALGGEIVHAQSTLPKQEPYDRIVVGLLGGRIDTSVTLSAESALWHVEAIAAALETPGGTPESYESGSLPSELADAISD